MEPCTVCGRTGGIGWRDRQGRCVTCRAEAEAEYAALRDGRRRKFLIRQQQSYDFLRDDPQHPDYFGPITERIKERGYR